MPKEEQPGLAPETSDVEALRAEVRGLTSLVRSVLAEREVTPLADREAEIAKRQPLEPRESERDRILNAWSAEPRVAIFIAPDENETRIRDERVARGLPSEFPPRTFQVNGVQLAVPVGKSTSVPESIAAMYEYMLNPWQSQQKLPPLTFEQMEARLSAA